MRGKPSGVLPTLHLRNLRTLWVGLFLTPPLAGQTTLAGTVRHDSTGRPVAGVEVLIRGTDRHTLTDTGGRYVLGSLPSGRRVALFRSVGFRPVELLVLLGQADTVWANPTLVSQVAELEPIVVTGRPKRPRGRGVEEFEERRLLGFGKYIDSTELRRSEHRHLQDLLRGIAGVAIVPAPPCARPASGNRSVQLRQQFNCVSDRLARYAVSSRQALHPNCLLQVVLDGMVVSKGGSPGQGGPRGWETAFDLNTLSVAALQAVEVYRSAAEVPTEFGGSSAACGTILFWTRR